MSAQKITILSMREAGDSSDDVSVFSGHLTKQDLAPEIHDFVQDYIAWSEEPDPEEGQDYFVHVEQSQLTQRENEL